MAPIDPFRLTSRDKTDRAAQAATFELVGRAAHNLILHVVLESVSTSQKAMPPSRVVATPIIPDYRVQRHWFASTSQCQLCRTLRFHRVLANGRNRRVSPVAPRRREGPLTEPTAGAQPWPRERVLMPHTCRSQLLSGSARLGECGHPSSRGWPLLPRSVRQVAPFGRSHDLGGSGPVAAAKYAIEIREIAEPDIKGDRANLAIG
jgi:hypothetical protein